MTDTPRDKVERYKHDAGFFQKLRASVKLRYAEEIDYRDYEKQIQKMLNTYVQADEIIQVVEPVNIFEREAFEAEVAKMQGDRAKADTIANRTKKTITEKMEEDPFFYRKFSALLQQAIDDYKAQRISEAQYLARVTDIMEQVRDGKVKEAPDMLKERDLSRALFDLPPSAPEPRPCVLAAAGSGVSIMALAQEAAGKRRAIKDATDDRSCFGGFPWFTSP